VGSIDGDCPACHTRDRINDCLLGKLVLCPECGTCFLVKAPGGEQPGPPDRRATAPVRRAMDDAAAGRSPASPSPREFP